MISLPAFSQFRTGAQQLALTICRTEFQKYYDQLYIIAKGIIGIYNEVGKSDEGSGKIWEPFSANNMMGDSAIVESPNSENSMTDFKNNITGAYNVYLGKYKT